MKARIEKKLSKRLTELLPVTYKDAWQEDHHEPSELAYNQGSRVSGLMCVGGGLDYWGEGQDAYSVWESFDMNWPWILNFDLYPKGHKFEYFPDVSRFKNTTINKFKTIRSQGIS